MSTHIWEPTDDILAVIGDDILVGTIADNLGKPTEGVLTFTREQYHQALDKWLDAKRTYCEMWGEFCGVGYLDIEGVEIEKQYHLNLYDEESDSTFTADVKGYRVVAVGEPDLEHG